MDTDNGSQMGINWVYTDFQIEGYDELFRMVWPVPKALGLNENIWYQVEHQAKEAVGQQWPAGNWRLYERGEITDHDAVAALERKTREYQAQHGMSSTLILPT